MIGWGSYFPTNGRENAQKLRAKGRVLRGRPRVKHFYKARLDFAELVVVGITPRTPWDHQKSQKKLWNFLNKIFFKIWPWWNETNRQIWILRRRPVTLPLTHCRADHEIFILLPRGDPEKIGEKINKKIAKTTRKKNQNEKMRLIFSCLLDPKTSC